MMKSFFKKLASVLALAMVVSLAAPAAQTAQAAEAKKFTYHYSNGGSAVTTVNLAKTGDTVDLNFVGIKDYKDYKTQWIGYGTGFTVDQSGVITATENVGEGLVWLSVGDDQTYVSDPVKVTVGEYTNVTIGSQDKSNRDLGAIELTVGDKKDLAFFGILDWNIGKYTYKWVIENPSVLAVDQKTGEIEALAAGETTVKFMAVNKYNTANVIITKPLTVTVNPDVEPGIVVDQETQNKFFLNFTDLVAANYDEDDIEMVRIFPADNDTNGDGTIDSRDDEGEDAFFIKPVTVDKDNNRLVIDTYADFVDGATYEVRIGKYTNRFVASVGEVASIELSATTGYVAAEGISAIPAELKTVLRDANGIDVTTVEVKGIKNVDNITYTIKGSTDNIYLNEADDEVIFIEEGVVTVTATFDYYDRTDKLLSNPCQVKGVRHTAYIAEVIAWDIVDVTNNDDKIVWDEVVKNNTQLSLAVQDNNRFVVALLKDSRGNYFTTHVKGTEYKYQGEPVRMMDYIDPSLESTFVFAANGYYVEFATLNPDNLLINADGSIVTYKETVSAVELNVYNIYDEKVADEIATVPIKVKAKRKLTYVESDNKTVTGVTDTVLDKYDSYLSQPTVDITLYDQYKDQWFGGKNLEVTLVKDSAYKQAEIDNLEAYIDTLSYAVDYDGSYKYTFNTRTIRQALLDANIATNYSNRTAVSFKITELNSGRFVTVTVRLLVPNFTTDEVTGDVAIDQNRANNMTIAEKYDTWTPNVNQRAFVQWDNKFFVDRMANVTLYETSKGYNVGISEDMLLIADHPANKLNINIPKYSGVQTDDRIILVTDKNKNVVPEITTGGTNVTVKINGKYATSGALGVTYTQDAVTNHYTYQVVAANHMLPTDAGYNEAGQMAYLVTGQYTVQVLKVKSINYTTGQINLYPTNDGKTSVVKTFNVTNTNPKITYAGQISRDLRESADSVEEVVANAFNFNLVNDGNVSGWLNDKQDNRDILEGLVHSVERYVGDGYVYIKSVTFKVPVNSYMDYATDASYLNPAHGFYYITVPVGSSVKVSTDLYYFN